MRDINYIVIHHSGTKDGKEMSWDNIRNYHIKHNGWQDIGYHFGIEQIENTFEVLVGRPLILNGAHAPGRNCDSIGIMFCGNYDTKTSPEKMIQVGVRRIIKPMMKVFDIPVENILKHSDVNKTNCPGKLFLFDYLVSLVDKQ